MPSHELIGHTDVNMKGTSPQVLLVEDDPISREVLALAIAALPADVVAVESLAQARVALATRVFQAWMVDAHLPDGAGVELLALRPSATIALAHTASNDPLTARALQAAGFSTVLVKPLPAGAVQAALRRALGEPAGPGPADAGEPMQPPPWDDAAALRALGGHAANVGGLRDLFVRELEPTLPRLQAAFDARDAATLQGELHRLKASCGFVGAAQLACAVQAASRAPDDAAVHAALHAVARATLRAPYPSAA